MSEFERDTKGMLADKLKAMVLEMWEKTQGYQLTAEECDMLCGMLDDYKRNLKVASIHSDIPEQDPWYKQYKQSYIKKMSKRKRS